MVRIRIALNDEQYLKKKNVSYGDNSHIALSEQIRPS